MKYYLTPKNQLTKDEARSLFYYENNNLYRKKSKSGVKDISKPIGCIDKSKGYRVTLLTLDGIKKKYYVHTLIWNYHNGIIENGKFIDHINRTPQDNNISNLRLVNGKENQYNSSIRSDNTSGVTGVFWKTERNKWHVKITVDGKRLDLGYYDTFNEAVNIRKNAEEKYHKIT